MVLCQANRHRIQRETVAGRYPVKKTGPCIPIWPDVLACLSYSISFAVKSAATVSLNYVYATRELPEYAPKSLAVTHPVDHLTRGGRCSRVATGYT